MVAPFAKERPPFRMAENHIATTEVFQHRGGDFSGVGALILPEHVLRSELNRERDLAPARTDSSAVNGGATTSSRVQDGQEGVRAARE